MMSSRWSIGRSSRRVSYTPFVLDIGFSGVVESCVWNSDTMPFSTYTYFWTTGAFCRAFLVFRCF